MASSVVRDETKGKTYLKLVNALPTKVCLKVNGINLSLNTKYMMFGGRPESKTTERILNDTNNTSSALIIGNNIIQLPAYSVVGIEL